MARTAKGCAHKHWKKTSALGISLEIEERCRQPALSVLLLCKGATVSSDPSYLIEHFINFCMCAKHVPRSPQFILSIFIYQIDVEFVFAYQYQENRNSIELAVLLDLQSLSPDIISWRIDDKYLPIKYINLLPKIIIINRTDLISILFLLFFLNHKSADLTENIIVRGS